MSERGVCQFTGADAGNAPLVARASSPLLTAIGKSGLEARATDADDRWPWRNAALMGAMTLGLAACATGRMTAPAAGGPLGVNGTMRPYEVGGVWYRPRNQPGYEEVGLATWYGQESAHRRTADGETFDVRIASAAHKTLPLPCLVEVTDLASGRRIRVRVNDRGPFVAGRIIDLSPRAAAELGVPGRGAVKVKVRYIGPAPIAGLTPAA